MLFRRYIIGACGGRRRQLLASMAVDNGRGAPVFLGVLVQVNEIAAVRRPDGSHDRTPVLSPGANLSSSGDQRVKCIPSVSQAKSLEPL